MAPIPAVRRKRSKELSTSCQAVSRLGTSASDEGVVIVVMALLSFADSIIQPEMLSFGHYVVPSFITASPPPPPHPRLKFARRLRCPPSDRSARPSILH